MIPNTSDFEAVRLIRLQVDEDLQDAERITLEKIAYAARSSCAIDSQTLVKANAIATRYGFKPFSLHLDMGEKKTARENSSSVRLVLYSKQDCGYCKRSKEFLAKHNIAFEDHSLDDEQARMRFYEEASQRWQKTISTVPQIVIEIGGIETLIGSYQDLIKSGIERTYHLL